MELELSSQSVSNLATRPEASQTSHFQFIFSHSMSFPFKTPYLWVS